MSSSDLQYCLYSTGKSPGLPGRGPFLFCFLVFSRFRPGLSCSPSGGSVQGGSVRNRLKTGDLVQNLWARGVGNRGCGAIRAGSRVTGRANGKNSSQILKIRSVWDEWGQARKQGRFSIKEEAVTGMWLAPSFKKILMVLTYDFFRTFSAFCREPELPSG